MRGTIYGIQAQFERRCAKCFEIGHGAFDFLLHNNLRAQEWSEGAASVISCMAQMIRNDSESEPSCLKALRVTNRHGNDEVQRSGAQDVEESIWERISGQVISR